MKTIPAWMAYLAPTSSKKHNSHPTSMDISHIPHMKKATSPRFKGGCGLSV